MFAGSFLQLPRAHSGERDIGEQTMKMIEGEAEKREEKIREDNRGEETSTPLSTRMPIGALQL